jgi:hypothetical protein
MDHLDEHTLELFVVGSSRVQDRKAEIEAHLAACPTCMDLAVRMKDFYADFERSLSHEKHAGSGVQRAITRSRRQVQPAYERYAGAVHVKRSVGLTRAWWFARQHPIAAIASSVALFAGLALALNFLLPRSSSDMNPSYCKMSLSDGVVQVRNGEDKTLWTLPTKVHLDVTRPTDNITFGRAIFVRDLNGDGVNEVVSILPLGDENYNRTLRIYDNKRKLLVEKSFSELFHYLDRVYSPNIDMGSVLVANVGLGGAPEIWVSGNSRDRSPGVTIRLDVNGNILGKYWHFGQLRDIYCVRLGPDQKEQVVLTGVDDAEDTTHREFPVIVVLDPARVVGESRSLRSPGFPLPTSDAEIYYISLPHSDMNYVLNCHPSRNQLIDTSSSVLQFRISTLPPGQQADSFEFDYFFNLNMSVQEVKSNNHTDLVRENLVRQGILQGSLDREYLDRLKNGVKYWDTSRAPFF